MYYCLLWRERILTLKPYQVLSVDSIYLVLITFSPELADKEKLWGNYSKEILGKLILTKHKLTIYSLAFKMTFFASPNKYVVSLGIVWEVDDVDTYYTN